MTYDPQRVAQYFDAFGEREWQRLELSAFGDASDTMLTHPGSSEFHQPITLNIPNTAASALASDRLVELEVALCEEPGLVDAGGHLIGVGRRPEAR